MSDGPNWFSWFTFPLFAPLSGSVNQNIKPAFYRGIWEIERTVLGETGGYGMQLGIISEALEDLVEQLGRASGGGNAPGLLAPIAEDSPLGKLRKLVADVKAIKARHRDAIRNDAEQALKRLKEVDSDGYKALAATL